jgi:hypothetical protein
MELLAAEMIDILFKKICENIWWVKINVLPLHR